MENFGNMNPIQTRRTFVDIADIADLGGLEQTPTPLWVRGRIHKVRGKGNCSFLVLRSGLDTVQAALFAGRGNVTKVMIRYAGKLPLETVVEVFAEVVGTPQPTQCTQSTIELKVLKIFAISVADSPLPLNVEDASRPDDLKQTMATVNQSTRLNNRCLDLRTPTNQAIFRIQSRVCQAFRQFLLDKNFIEIHTPKITPGVSEGGAEVFRTQYFDKEACLAQSPQLYKQMAAACGGLGKVFEIGPVFRAENSFSHRHLCEFVGMDFEMEIVNHYHEVLTMLGELFVYIFDFLNKECIKEMKTIQHQYPFEPLEYTKTPLVISFKDAVTMLRDNGIEKKEMDDFNTAEEKALGEIMKRDRGTDFYIVDKYPISARPFYTMPCPEDPNYTNSYDVFLRGEEITSGAQRIHDVKDLTTRAQECNIPLSSLENYLKSFKYGTPPHGGAGIGLERVVMLFLNLNNVRKTSMFPRDPKRLEP